MSGPEVDGLYIHLYLCTIDKNTNRMEYIIHNPGVILELAVCIQNFYNDTIFFEYKTTNSSISKEFSDLIFEQTFSEDINTLRRILSQMTKDGIGN